MLRLNDLILLLVLFSSMALGIVFPQYTGIFRPYPLYLMMFLMFLSFIPIRPGDILSTLRDSPGKIAILAALKLLILPACIYALFRLIYPEYAAGALLLSGVSTGVVAPFISTLVGGNGALVLLLVVISSLLVPLTLPAVVKVLLFQDISLPLGAMVRNLAIVIFIPILCVEIFKRLSPRLLQLIETKKYPLSLVCFASINMGIFSGYSQFFRQRPQTILEATFVAVVLAFLLGGAGILVMRGRPAADQIASAISMANVNNVLIIVFASGFFGPLEPTLAAMYMIPFFGVILPMRLYIRAKTASVG